MEAPDSCRRAIAHGGLRLGDGVPDAIGPLRRLICLAVDPHAGDRIPRAPLDRRALGHPEARRAMRARGQFLGTVLVVGLVAAAGVYLQREVAPRALAAPVAGAATTGAWFCPHGGGPAGTKDWHATLAVANPGRNPVRIRVTELGS